MMSRSRLHRAIFAYGFLMPALLIVLSLIAYPLYVALNVSLREGATMNFAQIGQLPLSLRNYAEILTDSETWSGVWRSVVYTVGATAPSFILGLATALLLNRRFPARRLFRTLILIPWAVPGVVASIGFLWMLDASYGVVNYILESIGLIPDGIAWLSNPDTAMFAVILPTVWKGYPFFTLALLAALQSIPEELYEAARVDGASPVSQFRYITWPGIRTTAVLTIVLIGLWVFREFDFIYPLTGGGPDDATETLAIRIYNEAFDFFNMGIAGALGIVTLLIAAVFVLMLYPKMRQSFF